ncbi:Dephospho-CoA kinase [Thermococcus barophilus]|uniref:Dephospho-CoA kinase n=1 Tax=Thermococcus barophilus TaxID=55802 RepID=A0A0S1XCV7_THEBA|nr:Dephospho-CoA kinase [Thermococcus barophilus]
MIIGVVGKIAAGKTTIAKFLEENGFCRISCSDPLIDLLTHNVDAYSRIPELPQKAEPTRDKLIEYGRYLKETYGEDILIRLALDKMRHCKDVVIDGVRSRGEIEAIKRRGGAIIYVEAKPELRYERLVRRKAEKDKDINSFDDFKRMDDEEERLYHTSKLKDLADFVIVNEGTLGDLRKEVKKILEFLNTLVVIAPCLLSPFTVYRGPKEKEYRAASALMRFFGKYHYLKILAYPCPEFILLGFPRLPASKEVYEKLGMREYAKKVAEFIARSIEEEQPSRVILIGVKGSPTCGVFHTTSSDPEEYPYEKMEEFKKLSKKERFKLAAEIAKDFKLIEGEGTLFELLKRKIEGIYLEFDKDNLEGSLKRIEKALRDEL